LPWSEDFEIDLNRVPDYVMEDIKAKALKDVVEGFADD